VGSGAAALRVWSATFRSNVMISKRRAPNSKQRGATFRQSGYFNSAFIVLRSANIARPALYDCL